MSPEAAHGGGLLAVSHLLASETPAAAVCPAVGMSMLQARL